MAKMRLVVMIDIIGDTGNSRGPHLDFKVWDPQKPWVDANYAQFRNPLEIFAFE